MPKHPFGAGNRGRTCTNEHKILNLARLPIPPYPRMNMSGCGGISPHIPANEYEWVWRNFSAHTRERNYYTIFALFCQGVWPKIESLTKDNSKIKLLYVILSGVELSPSEERGESASLWAKRDLVTNLGVLSRGCYIDTKVTQTRLEIPSSHSLLGFSSLLAQKNFDSAQDDIQEFYFAIILC